MCGIFGVIDSTGGADLTDLMKQMSASLKHRGPDSSGIDKMEFQGGCAYLGANRLKILDLRSAGDQPMFNEDGKVCLSYNGEAYNFGALKAMLCGRGHVFKSLSDTEVLVHLYEEAGEDMAAALDGMFAFAVFDRDAERLILGRDRTGKKPVFYCEEDGRFAFASEIKALLVCPWIKKKVNDAAIAEYLSYGYISAPDTAYSGINELPAGHILILEKGLDPELKQYFELKDETVETVETDAASKIKQLVFSAVSKRLMSDVPVGVLLSGGLDSTIVAGAAARAQMGTVRTFCAGFSSEPSFDERKYARVAAKHFKTDHTEITVSGDPSALAEEIPVLFDQPFGDSSAIPALLVSREARKYVTVALTGDGGDECFAGYDRFRAALLASKMPLAFQRLAGSLAKILPRSTSINSLKTGLERFTSGMNGDVISRHDRWLSVFDRDELAAAAESALSGFTLKARAKQEAVLAGNVNKDILRRLLELNFHTYLKYDLNTKMDRCSMAASLEARSPLLDTDLYLYAFSLPSSLKIKGGTSKYILKKAFTGFVPQVILNRKKHGFGSPVSRWFKGELAGLYTGRVISKDARSAEYIRPDIRQTLLSDHLSGRRDNGKKLWTVLQLELWLRNL